MKLIKAISMVAVSIGLHAATTEIEEPSFATDTTVQAREALSEANYSRHFIPYVKLGPTVANIAVNNTLMPSGGIGIRSESQFAAVDCSFNLSGVRTTNGERIEHWTAPKVTYSRYLNPYSPSGIFIGYGGAWGGLRNDLKEERFNGLFGIISTGVEYGRDSSVRLIWQIELIQPALAFSAEKKSGSYFTPIAETSFGIGF